MAYSLTIIRSGVFVKKGFWTADWFADLIIVFAVMIAWKYGIIDSWFERPAYDLGVRMTSAEPSDQIAIISIDEQSIGNIGRWPWSRDVHASMIEILEQGGAKASVARSCSLRSR